ncbi:MAG: hypothetical protein Kow0075_05740 [Salibacteraceae bacterium]
MKSLTSVCFICLDAYGVFYPKSGIPFGGAQYRSVTLARGLARDPNLKVSFMLYDYGQPAHQVCDGVHVIRSSAFRNYHYLNRRTLRMRTIQDRFTSIAKCNGRMEELYEKYYPLHDLKKTGADVFCVFGLNKRTLDYTRWIKAIDKTPIVFMTHDEDVADFIYQNSMTQNRHGVEGHVLWEIYNENSHFVCQNDFQLQMLKDRFGKAGLLLNNPIDLTSNRESKRETILWVGRDTPIKRPKLFIELARLCPEEEFVMILNPSPDGDFEEIQRTHPSNLKLIKQVAADEIEHYFEKAKAFVNTAESEGVPNTFLQAAKYRVPILTLGVDPNEMLSKHGCGKTFESVDQVAIYLNDSGSAAQLRKMGQQAFTYVEQYHDLASVSNKLRSYFAKMVG